MLSDQDILRFWFIEAGSKNWFRKSDAFDSEVRSRFETTAIALAADISAPPHEWEASPESTLALIIALDQFPRNMYRNTPAAFAWDHHARHVADRMVEKNWDLKIPQKRRAFVYMPFMHAENLGEQTKCVDLMDRRLEDPNSLKHAKAHRQVIERFGRFPHRNDILNRVSTPEETEFLATGGYAP